MIYFIDIDGTLTDKPRGDPGNPNLSRIAKVKALISEGAEVVIWSARGTTYARDFAAAVGIEGAVCIGKPGIMIDDNPTIRPPGRIRVLDPAIAFGESPAVRSDI